MRSKSTRSLPADGGAVIDAAQVDRAVHYLATTDESIADARVSVLRTEYLAEVAEAMAYKYAEGSIEDRKREAKTVQAVKDAKDEHFKAVREYEVLKAKRKRAELTIELFRTSEASRRVGNLQ